MQKFFQEQHFYCFVSEHYCVQKCSHFEVCLSFLHVDELKRLHNPFPTESHSQLPGKSSKNPKLLRRRMLKNGVHLKHSEYSEDILNFISTSTKHSAAVFKRHTHLRSHQEERPQKSHFVLWREKRPKSTF